MIINFGSRHHSSGLIQSLHGLQGRSGSSRNSELLEDMFHVLVNRPDAQTKNCGNFGAGFSQSYPEQNLGASSRQAEAFRQNRRGIARQRLFQQQQTLRSGGAEEPM